MLLTQVFVYSALEQESLFNSCGYFIFSCIEKNAMYMLILMYFGNAK